MKESRDNRPGAKQAAQRLRRRGAPTKIRQAGWNYATGLVSTDSRAQRADRVSPHSLFDIQTRHAADAKFARQRGARDLDSTIRNTRHAGQQL
jgi:hypothetical protein